MQYQENSERHAKIENELAHRFKVSAILRTFPRCHPGKQGFMGRY